MLKKIIHKVKRIIYKVCRNIMDFSLPPYSEYVILWIIAVIIVVIVYYKFIKFIESDTFIALIEQILEEIKKKSIE